MSDGAAVKFWILALLLAAVHLLLHVGFSYGRGAPDLLTLGILLASREVGLGRSAGLGLFFGLLEDALSVLSFGANSVAMAVVACLGALTKDFFVGDSKYFLVSYLFIGKWVRDLVHWVAVGWVDTGAALRQPFVEQVLIDGGIASLYVAAVGVVVGTLIGAGAES
jgi:cell shape-determining protein MreD